MVVDQRLRGGRRSHRGLLELEMLSSVWFAETWLAGNAVSVSRPADGYFQPRRFAREAPAGHAHLEPQDLAVLRELRGVLRDVVDAIAAGKPLPAALVDRLNRFLEAGSIRYRLSGYGNAVSVNVLADPNDARAIATAVALSAAEFLAGGELIRLKQCDNDGCRWVFYDTTKNGSRRWCDAALCGNVDKVRRYRERHKPDH